MNGRPSVTLTAAVEIERLDRDQRLVVVHAQRRVIAAPRGGVKHRIGRERAARLDAFAAQRGDGRRDDLDILASERAAFAGMRVEPGDRDDRPGDPEIADQRGMRHAPGMDDRGRRQFFDGRAQRQMDRHRHDAQLRPGQHHHRVVRDPGKLGEEFGVPGMPETGPVERVLVDRVGHERGGAAVPHVGDGGLDRADHQHRVGRDRGGPVRPATLPPTGTHRQRLARILPRSRKRPASAITGTSQPRRCAIAARRSGSSIR